MRRVRNLALLTMVAVALSLAVNVGSAPWYVNAFLVATIACLGVGCLALHLRHLEAAVQIVLWTMTTGLSALMWAADGLHDPALAAYPGVLLMGAMLGHSRTVIAILVAMVANVVALAAANLTGWYVNPVPALTWSDAMDHLTILVVIALVVLWLAGDLRRALERADRENEQVRAGMERIRYLSYHDALTGLPNRAIAEDRFAVASAAARRSGEYVALLYLDLDDFKVVNDTLGHPVGDRLLQAVAQRLAALLRETDTLCRFGGDEFLVLLAGLATREGASRVATKIVDALAQPFELDGHQVPTGASIGVVIFPDDAVEFDELVKRADLAMYQAKQAGRHGFRFYDAQLQTAIEDQLRMDMAMRASLAAGTDFHLAYQPQYDLRSGRLVGFEALLRWRHPELGDVSPGRFIPLAERSGLIVPLGAWVLEQACRQAKAWRDAGMDQLPVAVNVSSVQIRRSRFAHTVRDVLQRTRLPAKALELEITESLLVDNGSDAADALHDLAAQGVLLAIDDFGTGYSNLGYLRRFQVARLKIDRSFILGIGRSSHDDAIVRAIVQMAATLGIVTVAEGIETQAVREQLRALGCDQGQGFLWHAALPAAAAKALWRAQLEEHDAGTPAGSRTSGQPSDSVAL